MIFSLDSSGERPGIKQPANVALRKQLRRSQVNLQPYSQYFRGTGTGTETSLRLSTTPFALASTFLGTRSISPALATHLGSESANPTKSNFAEINSQALDSQALDFQANASETPDGAAS
jgi:hypothetical protein